MVARADIVAEARRWAGTPYHAQASKRGAGCDCKGLIVGVARALKLPEGQNIAANLANYTNVIDAGLLRQTLETVMRQTNAPQPGDVMLIRLGGKAQHLAIMTAPNRMIHCYQAGPGHVIEVPIGTHREIDSYWTWPSLEGGMHGN